MNYRGCKPASLEHDDWAKITDAVSHRPEYVRAVQVLREARNRPVAVWRLFPEKYKARGHDYINDRLRLCKVPFRLSRTSAYRPGEPRDERELAFVLPPQ